MTDEPIDKLEPTPEEKAEEERWNDRQARLKAALEQVHGIMDEAVDTFERLDIARVKIDASHDYLVQCGATKHQIAAMLRGVARDL